MLGYPSKFVFLIFFCQISLSIRKFYWHAPFREGVKKPISCGHIRKLWISENVKKNFCLAMSAKPGGGGSERYGHGNNLYFFLAPSLRNHQYFDSDCLGRTVYCQIQLKLNKVVSTNSRTWDTLWWTLNLWTIHLGKIINYFYKYWLPILNPQTF